MNNLTLIAFMVITKMDLKCSDTVTFTFWQKWPTFVINNLPVIITFVKLLKMVFKWGHFVYHFGYFTKFYPYLSEFMTHFSITHTCFPIIYYHNTYWINLWHFVMVLRFYHFLHFFVLFGVFHDVLLFFQKRLRNLDNMTYFWTTKVYFNIYEHIWRV